MGSGSIHHSRPGWEPCETRPGPAVPTVPTSSRQPQKWHMDGWNPKKLQKLYDLYGFIMC